MAVPKEMRITKATITPAALYSRVKRHREHRALTEAAETMESFASASIAAPAASIAAPALAVTPEPPAKRKGRPSLSGGARNGGRGAASKPALNLALNHLPGWQDREKTEANMTCRPKRLPADVQRETFTWNAERKHRKEKFKRVYKKATAKLDLNMKSDKTRGKRGYGCTQVAKDYNKLLQSPGDRKLAPSTLADAVKEGRAGMSPPERGRPRVIPSSLTRGVALQATALAM